MEEKSSRKFVYTFLLQGWEKQSRLQKHGAGKFEEKFVFS